MKNVDDMTDEEIKQTVEEMLNTTDEDRQKEAAQIMKEYNHFKNDTMPQILQLFEDEEYHLETCCQGLVIILKALIKNFGTKEILDACVADLTEDMDDLISLPVKE